MRKWVAASVVGLIAVLGGPPVLSSALGAGGDPPVVGVDAERAQPADPDSTALSAGIPSCDATELSAPSDPLIDEGSDARNAARDA